MKNYNSCQMKMTVGSKARTFYLRRARSTCIIPDVTRNQSCQTSSSIIIFLLLTTMNDGFSFFFSVGSFIFQILIQLSVGKSTQISFNINAILLNLIVHGLPNEILYRLLCKHGKPDGGLGQNLSFG